MNMFLVILGICIYFVISRIVTSFFLNFQEVYIHDSEVNWMHYLLWIPVLGDLFMLIVFTVLGYAVMVNLISSKMQDLVEAIKSRG